MLFTSIARKPAYFPVNSCLFCEKREAKTLPTSLDVEYYTSLHRHHHCDYRLQKRHSSMRSPLRPLYLLFFVTLLLLLSHQSVSLRLPFTITPPPAQNLTLTPFPPTPLAFEKNCIPERGRFTPCPDYYDCAQAIFQLPDLVGEGAFHNGEPDDVFRLPVRKTHGTCAVRIELIHEGSARQSASWHVILARALSLNEV